MKRSLALLTWPDYISPDTIRNFESEFDAKIELDIVPSAVELIERMRLAPPPDMLVPPDYAVRELGAEGLLARLDHGRLQNLTHVEPRFRRGRAHDPEEAFSVVKDWGTTGFMYRSDKVYEEPTTWADFWRLAETMSGKATVLDSQGEVIGAALKMRGASYNAIDPDALLQARRDLLSLRPHLLAFETNYKPLLRSGEAALALGWNGDAAALRAQGVPIRYVIPQEGSQIWEDDWAIASGARNVELAHEFINFVLRPEVAAQEARYTRYATGNRSARQLLDESMASDPATYPDKSVLGKLEPGLPLPPEGQRRRDELWAEFRS